ncbi:transcription factor bHLH110-like isoform X2 [Vicia villosa]|uniref:transcription factor bHLH110-like isoform X2 n=1 Tax=Vicia villosa TaxID=3911 RepID=UPI00273B58D9|nr:transcription factor bHLH110-like isoform X2 [Vicia villosa]
MIMESRNLHHLQDQQPPPLSSLSSSIPSSYAVGGGTTTIHSWTPTNITLNNAEGNFNSNLHEVNPRYSRSNAMIQDLGYHHQWTSDDVNRNHESDSTKEEISFTNFPKFTEMLNYTPPNSSMENYGVLDDSSATINMKNCTNDEHKDMNALMLKNLYTGGEFYNAQNYPNIGSQIHPSINISNMNPYSSSSSTTTLDMNMQSLDLLTSSQDHHLGRFTTNDHENLSFHLHPMQNQLANRSSSSNSINPSLLNNGGGETKRVMQSKASQSETALKKSRSSSESKPSCAPFKVRKEKLGDRIAALQQLVAPFGKTDTASVLMEAIGYIKFLQGQVETLSVPYMKSTQNQNNRLMQGDSAIGDTNGEPKQQYLRSRGLCLVPLSCMSYIAGDGSTEVWQQRPNFGGPA